MNRPTGLTAGDWFFNGLAVVGVLALVGGFVYVTVIADPGLFGQTPVAPAPPFATTEQDSVARPPVEAASRTPVGANLRLEADQRVRSGVYRCLEGGSLVFADQPCPHGRDAGFPPASAKAMSQRSAEGSRNVTARELTSTAPELRTSGERPASRAACHEIDEDLAQINTRARAGGSAPYQDWLRDQRRRLVDERRRLNC